MPRRISKNQLADFWQSNYYHPTEGVCILCGNSGYIDTTKSAVTPTGKRCGQVAFCLCPNGRACRKASLDEITNSDSFKRKYPQSKGS